LHRHRSGIVHSGIGSRGAAAARIFRPSSALTALQHFKGITTLMAGNFLEAATASKKGRPEPPPIPQRNNSIFFF